MSNIIFPSSVKTGKFYSVPHLHVTNFHGYKNIDLPICTGLHEDTEIIKFDTEHYHVDWRFVSRHIYDRLTEFNDNSYADLSYRVQASYIIEKANVDKNREVFYKVVKAKREYNNNYFRESYPEMYVGWPIRLQKHYCGEKLRMNDQGQYVCPHRGAVIDLAHVDKDGNAVCPAHMLRFNVDTLTAVGVPKTNLKQVANNL